MLKKIMIAGIATLALFAAQDVRAAGNDNGGFADSHFSDSASAALDDPSHGTDDAAAAAAASIEPAAGDSSANVFTTTQVGNAPSGAAQPVAPASSNGSELPPDKTTVYP